MHIPIQKKKIIIIIYMPAPNEWTEYENQINRDASFLRVTSVCERVFATERVETGRIFVVDLEGRTYRCKFCKTQLALVDDLVSRAFHCRRGKAYLISNAVNINVGLNEERMMLSGMHTVADIYCCCCGQIVGWKYEAAHERSQKYKEGKFVLDRGRIVDGLDSEFYVDTRPSMSDTEDV